MGNGCSGATVAPRVRSRQLAVGQFIDDTDSIAVTRARAILLGSSSSRDGVAYADGVGRKAIGVASRISGRAQFLEVGLSLNGVFGRPTGFG